MKKCLFVLIIVILIGYVYGDGKDDERSCSADAIAAKHIKKDPSIKARKEKYEARWASIKAETGGHTLAWNMKHGIKNKGVARRRLQQHIGNIDIPIIFHILHNTAHDKVEKYSTFITRLLNINLNYNEMNKDMSMIPRWNNVTGDMDMTFFINKILYYNVGANSPYTWQDNAIKTAGTGAAPIDAKHNLNVWFVRPKAASLHESAYASFPWDLDIGAVFNVRLINGDVSTSWGEYLTIFSHEFGHWVGLYHIWGFDAVTFDAPSCGKDDGVVDTPNMAKKWGNQCPANKSVNSCGGGQPDMFENFMSYASCINMFTDGQVARARSNFAGGGDRESFLDYQKKPTRFSFVNMFYFVGIDDNCMIGDAKKLIFKKGAGNHVLCVSYSRNPYVDVYEDIKLVTGACPAGYFKMDTNLVGGHHVCFKKVAQTKPLSELTIVDLDITHNKGLHIYLRREGCNGGPFPSGIMLKSDPSLAKQAKYKDPNDMNVCTYSIKAAPNKGRTKLAKHFMLKEFQSFDRKSYGRKFDHDDGIRVSPLLVECLEAVRVAVRRSVVIDTGYTTSEHNREGPKSMHLSGTAADINKPGGMNIMKYLDVIICRCKSKFEAAGYQIGLGLGEKRIHVDYRNELNAWLLPDSLKNKKRFKGANKEAKEKAFTEYIQTKKCVKSGYNPIISNYFYEETIEMMSLYLILLTIICMILFVVGGLCGVFVAQWAEKEKNNIFVI